MTDRNIELTRRKVLGATGVIGVASAGAGLGTSALFTDEESFTANSIQAGELDMRVNASVPTDGISEEWAGAVDFSGYAPPEANGEPGMGVTLGDMKPGDWVLLCYEIVVETNPACLSLGVDNTANDDNGLTEPEENEAGDTSGGDGEGELAQNLEVTVYDDLNTSALDGTLSGAMNALNNELLADVTLQEVWNVFDGGGAIATDTQSFDFYLLLELPTDVGNIVQSDSVEWDFTFDAVQSRHNECDTPVWEGEVTIPEAFSISASPNTAGEEDSIHRVEVPVGSGLDGETLSTLTVDYPSDFDVGSVDAGDVLNAGVQRTDSSITSLSITGVTTGPLEFTLDGSVSVSASETIFIEYRDITNAPTPDDYTVVLDVNGSEIGPATLTITPARATPESVTTTFDTDDDGWEIIGDAQGGSSVPTYESGIGNPAPSISAVDDVQGGVWYFKAPGKFLADKSDFYDGSLEYDLRQDSDMHNQFNSPDIILKGAGMELNYDHGDSSTHPPDESFRSYSVDLDESASWTEGGKQATQSEIQSVLGDLTGLFIRGEYESGPDEGYLDNVSMNP